MKKNEGNAIGMKIIARKAYRMTLDLNVAAPCSAHLTVPYFTVLYTARPEGVGNGLHS